MVYIGMIFQYNSDQKVGSIILSDGQKKEFTNTNWIDEASRPEVGQQIAFKDSANGIEIKVASEEDKNTAALDAKEKEEQDNSTPEYIGIDDYIEHFTNKGFKLIRNQQTEIGQTVTLRTYSMEEFSEVTIKEQGGKIDIMQTINGKPA